VPRLINVTHRQYLDSPAWRKKRSERLAVDGEKCFRCKATDGLQVHHITYERLGRERMSDLLTLCGDCHKRDHGRDPSLPDVMPDSWFTDRAFDRMGMELEQENIALAAGIDLEGWWL
jgi:5-methylcytosine-specific restriction endonuclease McrA